MNFLKKTESLLGDIFEGIGVFLIGLMTVGMIFSVIMRYCFNISFIWAEEMLTYFFIGTTFFGAVICQKKDEHIRISLLEELLPKSVQLAAKIVACIVTIFVLAFLYKVSVDWIAVTGDSISTGVKLPYKYFYGMVPVCSVGLIVFAVISLIKLLIPNYDEK